jgi:hypothetical protein
MSSNAVLPGAPPAASSSNETDFSEPHSQIAPSSEKYRLTGELPSEEDKQRSEPLADKNKNEDQSGKEDASAPSAAEQTQKRLSKSEAETRWQKRERELKELREENARLKASRQEPQRETEQAKPQPANPSETKEAKTKARPEPKIDDIDPKTGKALYPDYNSYAKDLRKWDREEALREFQEMSAKQTQEEQRTQTEQEQQRATTDGVSKAREKYADYDATMEAAINAKEADGRAPIYYEKDSPIDFFLRSQPNAGTDVLYHLAKNMSDPAIKAIFARTPDGTRYVLSQIDQIAQLAVIAHSLSSKSAAKPVAENESAGEGEGDNESSAKPISAAPRPPHQTSGKGTVGKDAIVEALEQGGVEGTERYMREQNARDLARRKKGK